MASKHAGEQPPGVELMGKIKRLYLDANSPSTRVLEKCMDQIQRDWKSSRGRHSRPWHSGGPIAMGKSSINALLNGGTIPTTWGKVQCLVYALGVGDPAVEEDLCRLWRLWLEGRRPRPDAAEAEVTAEHGAAVSRAVALQGLRRQVVEVARAGGARGWEHGVHRLVELERDLGDDLAAEPALAALLLIARADLQVLGGDWPGARGSLAALGRVPEAELATAGTDHCGVRIRQALICVAARQHDEARHLAGKVRALGLPEHRWDETGVLDRLVALANRTDRPGGVRVQQVPPACTAAGAIDWVAIDSVGDFAAFTAGLVLGADAHRRRSGEGSELALVAMLNLSLAQRAVPEWADWFEDGRRALLRAVHGAADGRPAVGEIWRCALSHLGLPAPARVAELRNLRDHLDGCGRLQACHAVWHELVLELERAGERATADAERLGLLTAIKRTQVGCRQLAAKLNRPAPGSPARVPAG
ncbi:hypothetical protein [Dactylosporangium sp. CS-033363]|uniref:hypothetical protein n=1 Tax=Dactylosporangium sp. CS-033363 TaxID=3239935 RepID=UPI003D8F7922